MNRSTRLFQAPVALSAVFVALAGCGKAEPKGLQISEAELGAAWPLTVPKVELLCEGPPPLSLARVDGKLYALNGSARSKAKEKGWLDGRTITKANPEIPEIKMDISLLVLRAVELCN